jgi:VWFA-related protein
MSKTASAIALSLVAILTFSGSLLSQFRARVDLVVVPVTVRGENGKLVVGLTKNDFLVTEDDKPQTITDFEVDPQPLSATIVVDDGMTATQLNWLYPPRSDADHFYTRVELQLRRPDDCLSISGRVYKLSEFTNDPAVIQKSFDGIKEIAKTRPEAPGDLLGEKGPKLLRSILNVLGMGKEAALKPRASGHLHDAIHEAAMALQDESDDRRKIIVVISDGRIVGKNDFSFAQNRTLLMNEQIQVYGVSAEFATFGSFRALTDYAQATGGDVFPGTSTRTLEASFGQVPCRILSSDHSIPRASADCDEDGRDKANGSKTG